MALSQTKMAALLLAFHILNITPVPSLINTTIIITGTCVEFEPHQHCPYNCIFANI